MWKQKFKRNLHFSRKSTEEKIVLKKVSWCNAGSVLYVAHISLHYSRNW